MGSLYSSPYEILGVSLTTSIREIKKKYEELFNKYLENKITEKRIRRISIAYCRILEDSSIPSIQNISDYLEEKERKIWSKNSQKIQDFYDKIAIREEFELLDLKDYDFYNKALKIKLSDSTFQENFYKFTRIMQSMDIRRSMNIQMDIQECMNITDISMHKKGSKKFWCRECKKVYKNEKKLDDHNEKVHRKVNDADFERIENEDLKENERVENEGLKENERIENEGLKENERVENEDLKENERIENEGLKEDERIEKGNVKNQKKKKNKILKKNNKRKEGLKKRIEGDQKDKPMFLKCGYCNQSFEIRKELIIHIRNVHNK